jgi:hypothetical protein
MVAHYDNADFRHFPLDRMVASMKFLCLAVAGILASFVPSAFAQMSEVLSDGFDNIASNQREVRDAVEVNRNPIFDNAPFLHLRAGDKLVKAKEKRAWAKSSAASDRIEFYLLSDDKYYYLGTTEESGKIQLFHAYDCLLFDWEMTLENATALRQILYPQYARSLTAKQFDSIVVAVQREMPEIDLHFVLRGEPLEPDRIISIPGQILAEFHGYAYEQFQNTVYEYSIKIGPTVFRITGKPLIRGPRHVERSEFERVIEGPNGTAGQDVDPKVAAVKKAEYDRMVQFQNLVDSLIRKKSL